jgi:hypothetical protein
LFQTNSSANKALLEKKEGRFEEEERKAKERFDRAAEEHRQKVEMQDTSEEAIQSALTEYRAVVDLKIKGITEAQTKLEDEITQLKVLEKFLERLTEEE